MLCTKLRYVFFGTVGGTPAQLKLHQSYHFTNGEEEQTDTGGSLSNDRAAAWSPFDIRVLPQTLLAGYLYYNRMKGPRIVDPNTYHRSLYADLSPGVPP